MRKLLVIVTAPLQVLYGACYGAWQGMLAVRENVREVWSE